MKSSQKLCSRCAELKDCLTFDLYQVYTQKEVKRYFCKECLVKIVQSWNFGGAFR